MSPLAIFLCLCNLLLDTTGQLSFKAAATISDDLDGIKHWQAMICNHWIWLGIVSYVAEFLAWLAILSVLPLSQAILVTCINLIGIMVGGRIFFQEKLTKKRLIAAALITAGVGIVSRG